MKVPRQNSLLIQCVRQNNCPTPKSQCNADNAYSKARGYGRGLCIKNGEGATREQEHGWVLAALPSISLMGHCYRLHTAVNSTTPVCEMITKMKGKHTARTVNGMAGIWDNFFSQDLAGRGNGTVPSLSGLFFIAPLTALQAADPCSAMARWEEQHKLLLSTSVFLLLEICTNRALFCF